MSDSSFRFKSSGFRSAIAPVVNSAAEEGDGGTNVAVKKCCFRQERNTMNRLMPLSCTPLLLHSIVVNVARKEKRNRGNMSQKGTWW